MSDRGPEGLIVDDCTSARGMRQGARGKGKPLAWAQPALFMTVRREIVQSPCETGARSREGGRHT